MKLRSLVSAGIVDAGLAALAAFVISLYAARTFSTEVLGYYAVFVTAFIAATTLPAQFLFVPYEVAAARRRPSERVSTMARALKPGTALAVGSAVISVLVAALISRKADSGIIIPLGVSMGFASFVSPLQDYLRRILHLHGRSWWAAATSGVQLAAVLVFLSVLVMAGLSKEWIPYLALAAANLSSIGFAVAAILRDRSWSRSSGERLAAGFVIRSGSWLAAIGLLAPAMGLVVNAVVLGIADAEVLGVAEAARVVARPILVVTTGLGIALRPGMFRVAQQRDRQAARRLSRLFMGVNVVAGSMYLLFVGVDWTGNIMSHLVPNAYIVPWLVAAVCLSNIVASVGFPGRYQLVGAGRERHVAAAEASGQLSRVASAFAVRPLGPFVIALGDTLLGLIRTAWYRRPVKDHYDGARQTRTPGIQLGSRRVL